ncbi:FeoB-associated Cys-rich membrane protein [Chrysiogenes arsenatis]|uniref:FeoB-associated Cys-rich membrane protein n=1 Tax=Chrysiogenes arsenatis TaxID=309797 RepID=UPI001267CA91
MWWEYLVFGAAVVWAVWFLGRKLRGKGKSTCGGGCSCSSNSQQSPCGDQHKDS